MTRLTLLTVFIIGCSGTPDTQPSIPPMPPSAVVEDCTNGCNAIPLANEGIDVGVLVAADTTLRFDLAKGLCARLTAPSDSASELHAADNGYKLTGCQVFQSS